MQFTTKLLGIEGINRWQWIISTCRRVVIRSFDFIASFTNCFSLYMRTGDSLFDIDLRALCAAAKDRDALIALHRVADASRYGSVVLAGDRVVRFYGEV